MITSFSAIYYSDAFFLLFSLFLSMSSTPPTYPQCSQATGRHTERANHIMGSPE